MDALFDTHETHGGPFALVYPERNIDRGEPLTYAIPAGLEVGAGDRVRVPLGRGGPSKGVMGIVVGVEEATDVPAGKLRAVLSVEGRGLTPELLELARWISGYYLSSMGAVLGAMVPAAVKAATGREVVEFVELTGCEPPAKLPKTAIETLEVLRRVPGEGWPIPRRRIRDRLELPNLVGLGRLERAGLVRRFKREVVKARAMPGLAEAVKRAPRRADLTLSADQAAGIARITAGLGSFAPTLLQGVTGSGKTEVYLRVIEEVVRRGGSAIVLVPEISLTPQTVGRFMARFGADGDAGIEGGGGGGVAVLHSGLTAAQRHHEWARIREGAASIVVGARSAIFAPVQAALGIIIVDEEHDGSYKQDQSPRYHARDVALKRGQLAGCPVVLGSASPSLESYANARAGRFGRVVLPTRVGGGSPPRVEVVDLLEERMLRAERNTQHAVGLRLERALGETLADPGAQSILLLNRRGFSSYICCPDHTNCRWVMKCDDCDASMVYHKRTLPDGGSGMGAGGSSGGGYVRCHHCLSSQKLPALCPGCSKRVVLFGIGTQRLEEELGVKFPELVLGENMLRLDSDTMNKASDYAGALERFARGDVRLLLGTQMIAKGLDFPNVQLIGVINADTALSMPDFRASERTFQLVSQVAGRAGRSVRSGGKSRVIIQTVNPEHPAIVAASGHDYEGFAAGELEGRRGLGLPPVTRMARVVYRDQVMERARDAADRLAGLSRGAIGTQEGYAVRGGMACPISRIGGYHRFCVEILAPGAGQLQGLLAHLRSMGELRSDASCAVDVDPISLM